MLKLNYLSLMVLCLALAGCKAKVTSCSGEGAKPSENKYVNFSIQGLKVEGKPHRLCTQKLTSDNYLSKLTPEDGYFYDYEYVPATDAFFFPDPDIKMTDKVKMVQNVFNYITVGNIVHHALELYERKISDLPQEERDKLTRAEKHKIIAEDMPKISPELLNRCFTDKRIRSQAKALLDAYSKYDGYQDDESPFGKVESGFCVFLVEQLPRITDTAKTDPVVFDKWYDKTSVLPQYNDLHSLEAMSLSGEEEAYLINAIECEENIDRRTLLAMELLRHNRDQGINLLGEILESGQYTKYLYAAWDMWVTSVQLFYCGASSSSIIPENYYRKVAAVCVNTVLRHIQNNPGAESEFDLGQAEYFATATNMRRFGGYYGNEAVVKNYD